jgi:cytidylate kinase
MTLRALRHGIDTADAEAVLACARLASMEYRDGRLFLDGCDAEAELRSPSVDRIVAQLSAIPSLREMVNEHVRRLAAFTDVVVEGRDMTTVVFPYADAKFYLDASAEARARRRFDQGAGNVPLEDVRRNIEMRDEIDKSKSVGALKIAADAEYLDSSHLTIQEVYDKVYGKILHLREHHGR